MTHHSFAFGSQWSASPFRCEHHSPATQHFLFKILSALGSLSHFSKLSCLTSPRKASPSFSLGCPRPFSSCPALCRCLCTAMTQVRVPCPDHQLVNEVFHHIFHCFLSSLKNPEMVRSHMLRKLFSSSRSPPNKSSHPLAFHFFSSLSHTPRVQELCLTVFEGRR